MEIKLMWDRNRYKQSLGTGVITLTDDRGLTYTFDTEMDTDLWVKIQNDTPINFYREPTLKVSNGYTEEASDTSK